MRIHCYRMLIQNSPLRYLPSSTFLRYRLPSFFKIAITFSGSSV